MDMKNKTDCTICGKSISKANYRRHLSVHDKERKSFACTFCNKKYLRKDRLAKHMKEKKCGEKIEIPIRKVRNENLYLCDFCGKTYRYKKNFDNHKSVCKDQIYPCSKCGATFNTKNRLRRHGCRLVTFPLKCQRCEKGFNTELSLKKHKRVFCTKTPSLYTKPKQCVTCKKEFNNIAWFNHHRFTCRVNYKKTMLKKMKDKKKSVSSRKQFGWGKKDPALLKLYRDNKHIIQRGHRKGKVSEEYNYEINNNLTYAEMNDQINEIYNNQSHSFKLNISFGYVLRNTETNELRFYYPEQNDVIFSTPVPIANRQHLRKLKDRIRSIDILQKLFLQRPNTKWTLYQLSVVRYTIFHMVDYILGNGIVPYYIKSKRCIIAFDKNTKGEFYTDNLCLFRCLAVHQGHSVKQADTIAKRLFIIYQKKLNSVKKRFDGVHINEIAKVEDIFKTNIDIYEMDEKETVNTVRRSIGKYSQTMNLNKYRNHLSLITSMNRYTKKYSCNHCTKLFTKSNKMKIHEKNCTDRIKLSFPGKYFTTNPDIFDRLADIGINVKMSERFYKAFAVFDFEACLMKVKSENNNNKLQWIQEHKPVSVSVCSNIDNFTSPKCFVECDEDALLHKMVTYLNEISHTNSVNMKYKFRKVFTRLTELRNELETSQKYNESNDDDDDDDDDDNDDRDDYEEPYLNSTCMDFDEYDPPSKEFEVAMSKPNSFRKYLGKL